MKAIKLSITKQKKKYHLRERKTIFIVIRDET